MVGITNSTSTHYIEAALHEQGN